MEIERRPCARRATFAAVVAACALAVTACGGGGADADDAEPALLTASQVGGKQTGEGTDLLVPAASTCAVDGSFIWSDASQGEVGSFERTMGGATEDVVVGVWPMSEGAAEVALERIGPDPSCTTDGTTVQSVNIGSSDADRTRSFEVRERDASGNLEAWKVRAYGYADGHMVTVWSQRADAEPSLDGVRELLREQQERVADARS